VREFKPLDVVDRVEGLKKCLERAGECVGEDTLLGLRKMLQDKKRLTCRAEAKGLATRATGLATTFYAKTI